MKRGQGTCSRFQSFQLTYHAHTTLIDIYRQSPIFSLVTNTQLRYNHVWYVCIPLNRPRYVHVPNRPLKTLSVGVTVQEEEICPWEQEYQASLLKTQMCSVQSEICK